MDTALWIYSGLLCFFVLVVFVLAGTYVVEQLRTPIEKRYEQVKQELLEGETAAGATSILSGSRIGVKDDKVRELADELGFDWTGYSGRNDRQLNFQRRLSPATSQPGSETDSGEPVDQNTGGPFAAFLARVGRLQPDLGGTARLDISDVPTTHWRQCREIVEARGWRIHEVRREEGTVRLVLSRRGTTAVDRQDPYFITGPSLSELRRYPAARRAAAEAAREFGVDPLSETALEETRARHKALMRKAYRFGALASLCGLTLMVLLITAWRPLTEGGVAAVLVGSLDLVLLIATVVGGVGSARTLRARAEATRPFTEGYERVAQAALRDR